MRSILLLCLAFTFSSLTAHAQQATEADSGSVRIVVLGSSTAAGTGPSDPDSAWVNRYRRHLQAMGPQYDVVNLAVGGYTTYQLLPTDSAPTDGRPAPDSAHNITQALSLDPDAILINLPSNDAANGFSVEDQLANYALMLERAEAQNVPIWIATTQPRNLDEAGRAMQVAMRDSTH
ncbi:MAG: SGNH/GDSL hydrolase family protein, partial [Rhodothermales bacterium]